MKKDLTVWEILDDVPTGFYFVCIVIALAVIQLYPLGLTIPVTELTRTSYNVVENLQPGDVMLIDQGYGTGSLALHEPGFVVAFKHAMDKELKIVIVSTSAEAPLLFERALILIQPESKGYVYGKDYIHLGYVAGAEAAIAGMLIDMWEVFPFDYQGTPIDQLELSGDITKPTNEKIALVWVLSSGSEAMEGWIRQGAVRYGIPQIGDYLEMDTPIYLPYYPVLLNGIINGGMGAAEYELLVNHPGTAITLTDGLSVVGIVVLVFTILGNIGYTMKMKGMNRDVE